jgi:hypothetical protein
MTSERPERAAGASERYLGASSYLGIALTYVFSACAIFVVGCEGPNAGAPVGSNTNWLTLCDETAECAGKAACVCGACSLECGSDADCAEVRGARCVPLAEPATRSQCMTDAPTVALGMCLEGCEPGGCPSEQPCVGGACVVSAAPSVELCSALPATDTMTRTRQDSLLVLLEELRSAGGIDCGGAAPSVAVAPLRWDTRLACAARALASDMAETRRQSLTDSAGRDTVARLALVQYAARAWGEAFALVPGDANMALAAILGDSDSCSRLVSPTFTQVGVGNVGDAYVVTIGTE